MEEKIEKEIREAKKSVTKLKSVKKSTTKSVATKAGAKTTTGSMVRATTPKSKTMPNMTYRTTIRKQKIAKSNVI